jgi:uncharacterized protein YjbI with pentapeptide repeats
MSMAGAANADWECCLVAGCMAAASGQNVRCLAHLAPDELATVLERIGRDGRVVASGVEISGQLLGRIHDALPRAADGRPRCKEADFRQAVFEEEADLGAVTFDDEARFDGATFRGDGTFEGATFLRGAIFEEATFEAGVRFGGASFNGEARFSEARFRASGAFDGASFVGHAGFYGATFSAYAGFQNSTFGGVSQFSTATLGSNADFSESNFTGRADFSSARFPGGASFDGASFERDADFQDASFNGDADFSNATFQREAEINFANATFADGGATFSKATFGHAQFYLAVFERAAVFEQATFTGIADFPGTTFAGDAQFWQASFADVARFREAAFRGAADFTRASFAGPTQFNGASFEAEATFDYATFEHTHRFGPVLALGSLRLDEASFLEYADIYASAERLSLVRARFPHGVNLCARWAEVALERADFGAPSFLATSSEFAGLNESALAEAHRDHRMRSGRPRLLSVRWANVGDLTVSGVDLSACRFVGAHHLDALRIEGGSSFALTPPHRKVTPRQAIAEEHEWRRSHRTPLFATGWYPDDCALPEELPESQLAATDVATIYRDLRKGREDNKDEPGAADFYYGEMEMRRLAGSAAGRKPSETGADSGYPRRPPGRLSADRGENLILTLYWLVSGYGLRASRALASLFTTVLVFAALLYVWGFDSDESFIRSLTFSLESTTSLFRAPERELTIPGEWLQMGLRLLGPLFFGLALLSLRGRVRR